jgi:hypothetical protein
MPIKKEHTAFRAYGYKDWGSLKKNGKLKRERVVTITLNNSRSQTEVEFTIDEAKQIIDEINDAIKQSKKNHDPLF